MLKVAVTNNSFLMLGSGTGRGSYIDSDIIFDDYGLPYFPAKRFKGLLRESAMEVLEMLQSTGLEFVFSEEIIESAFGSKTSPARIRIYDLYLNDHHNIISWLQYIRQEHPSILNKESIINALTEIRQQTAINEKGFAKENSLRTIRVLKPDIEFCGMIEIVDKSRRSEFEALLALACMNLKRAGSGRNRGWGKIKCSLHNGDGHDLYGLTLEMIKNLDESATKPLWITQEPIKNDYPEPFKQDQLSCTHKLEYWIVNSAPLIFTAPDGDENMVSTLDHIPGTAIHGYYANHFIRKSGIASAQAHKDNLFKQWFIDGRLQFSNAYPAYKAYGTDECKLYPVPMFIHTDKQEGELYNLVLQEADDTKSLSGYCCMTDNSLYNMETEKSVNFHLVRNSGSGMTDERLEGHVKEGGIFHYEAIKPGQIFHGCIKGSETDLRLFREIFDQGQTNDIRLGRSLNTQYGAATIEFLPIAAESLSVETPLFAEDEYTEVLDCGQLIMYLNSPLILNNEHGFSATSEEYLKKYLQEMLDIPKINIVKSFARMENRQSYSSHWKMHQPEFACWKAGSSFLLELTNQQEEICDITLELQKKLERLMREGIGEKCNLGYGQVRLVRCVPMPQESCKFIDYEYPKPDELPSTVKKIMRTVYEERLLRLVVTVAAARAKEYYEENKTGQELNTSLLGRLERICEESSDIRDFSNSIQKLRPKAAKPLNEMMLGSSSLFNNLTATDLEKWCRKYEGEWRSLEKTAEYLEEPKSIDSFYKDYWRVFFRTLRKLKKKDNSEIGGEQHA